MKLQTMGALVLAAGMAAYPLAARAELTFVFTYTDPAGVGFNDPTQGAARKAALEQTATLLAGYFPGYTASITLSVDGAETTDGTLAAAGSNANAAGICDPGFGARGDVGIKALGGADPDPGTVDGTVTVNFEDQTWGLGDTIDPADFDFKSTMLHELLHAMGFSNNINEDGSASCNDQPAGVPGAWGPYDNFLADGNGDVIDDGTFVLDGARWTAIVTGGAGPTGVLWNGPETRAANAGAAVPLYSPTPFSGGSSIAHLDDDFYTSSALLMEAASDAGQGTRSLSAIEVGMLKDLGFANATGTPVTSEQVFLNGFE